MAISSNPVATLTEYELRHLAVHLAAAGRGEDLHRLLALETSEGRNAWYEAREQLGQTAGYLADVSRAWRLAQDEFAEHQSPIFIGRQCRYALIVASLNSLASNVPPELLVTLVEKRVWAPTQGLTYAQQVAEPARRVEALVTLVPHLPGSLREDATQRALAAVREIKCKWSRVLVLTGLAGYLPEPLLKEALDTAHGLLANDEVWVLNRLAPHLSELLLEEALAGAREIRDEQHQGQALTALAPYLPESLLEEMLAAAREIRNEQHRGQTLIGLVPYLSEPLLREALVTAREIRNKWSRAVVLMELISYLPKLLRVEALHSALAAAQGIRPEWYRANRLRRAWILAGLAAHLPEPWLVEALAAVQKVRDNSIQSQLLVTLASHLSEPLRGEALQEAWVTMRGIKDESSQARLLVKLAAYLPEPWLGETLAAVREIRSEKYRAHALTELASYLPKPLLEEALVIGREIKDRWSRAILLARLAPRLPEPLRQEVMQELVATSSVFGYSSRKRAVLLAELTAHLPESLLGEALAAARQFKHEWPSAAVFAGLAPRLPETLLEEALAMAREAETHPRSWPVPDSLHPFLFPYLPESLMGEALQEALAMAREAAWATAGLPPLIELPMTEVWASKYRQQVSAGQVPRLPESPQRLMCRLTWEFNHGWSREWILSRLAPYLPKLWLGEALAMVREIGDKEVRSQVLDKLNPYLSGPLSRKVPEKVLVAREKQEGKHPVPVRAKLAQARKIPDEEYRAQELVRLAPHLSVPLLQEALAAASGIREEKYQAQALAGLVPYLPESLGIEALHKAREIMDDRTRLQLVIKWPLNLARLSRQYLYRLWKELLPLRDIRTRQDLLAELDALKPIIAGLGGPEAILGLCRAIQDVGRWWP